MSATDTLHREAAPHICPASLPLEVRLTLILAQTRAPRFHKTDAPSVGNSENTVSNQVHSKGVGTGTFEKNHAEQKVSDHTETGAQFMKAQLGNEKGK
jgi:hypothetical protein